MLYIRYVVHGTGGRNLSQYWLTVLVSGGVIVVICAVTVGVQLKRLDAVLAEGLGGVMAIELD